MASEPAAAPPLLELDGLEVSFKARAVLRGLSFSVARGEIFGLLGPNGCGKSTTFHVLTGLLRPSAGTIRLDGAPIAPGDRTLRKQMGVVFQAPSVDPNLTCRENLQLAGRLHRVPRAELGRRVDDLLALADLTDRARDRVKALSGGMRRRLELSRGLVHHPRLLLLDEPTVGLDATSFERAWQRLDELRARDGLTILLSTHRPEEAARCDRLALVHAGRIVALDTPQNLQASVSGDVLTLSGERPDELSALILERFGLQAAIAPSGVSLLVERGHEWIPRLVEGLPPGRLSAVNMHQPSLADVFLKMTGDALTSETAPK